MIVVTGPPGAPAEAVAAGLAGLLGWSRISTDDQIAHRAGRPVSHLIIDEGEQAYRALERAVVNEILSGPQETVVVLGGGAVMDPRTRDDLAGRHVVFVDVTISVAARDLGLSMAGPTAVVNPRAQWLRMLAERRPVYEALATATVLADGTEIEELVSSASRQLGLG